jgi:hypothetical protein
MRLAYLVLIGGALASSGFLLLLLPVPQLFVSDHGARTLLSKNLLRGIVCFVPFCCGVSISLLAGRRLKRGIDSDVWTEAELAPLRTRLDDPAWTVLILLFFAAYIGSAFATDISHGTGLRGVLMIFILLISQLKTIVRPKRVAGGGQLQDWRNFKPIQSEHWGEPR